jgi:biotin carboxyl carrier protein
MPPDAGQAAAGPQQVPALPDAGQVSASTSSEGDIVEDGQTLAIVEAMKMENVLKAESARRSSKVRSPSPAPCWRWTK